VFLGLQPVDRWCIYPYKHCTLFWLFSCVSMSDSKEKLFRSLSVLPLHPQMYRLEQIEQYLRKVLTVTIVAIAMATT
jgi:hypothetical protein